MTQTPPWTEIDAATGAGIRVLAVDSGVQRDHPALEGREIKCWQVVESDGGHILLPSLEGGDDLGHGTAVLGTLHHYLPQATIESVRVFGRSLRACSRAILAGLRWALDQDYQVINCSFGSPDPKYLSAYKKLVDEAYCKNVLLVAASNNVNFRRQEYPSYFPSVISTDFGQIKGLSVEHRPGQMIEFVCRGSQVRVPWKGGEYRTVSGSSFAAPHLTALVARIRELRPYWTVHHVKAALYELATFCPVRPTYYHYCSLEEKV